MLCNLCTDGEWEEMSLCVCEEMDGGFELIDVECFCCASVSSPQTNTQPNTHAGAQTHTHTLLPMKWAMLILGRPWCQPTPEAVKE